MRQTKLGWTKKSQLSQNWVLQPVIHRLAHTSHQILNSSRSMDNWDSRIQGVHSPTEPSNTGDTGDWQLKRPNGILYTIRVENFEEKLKRTRPGKSVDSKTFSIGESKFRLRIIPTKRSLDESMRIFLRNESGWVVKVSCVLTVKSHKEDLREH